MSNKKAILPILALLAMSPIGQATVLPVRIFTPVKRVVVRVWKAPYKPQEFNFQIRIPGPGGSSPVSSPPAFVQAQNGSGAGADTTVAAAAISATTGNLIWVSVTYSPTTTDCTLDTVSSVTDTASNTYVHIGTFAGSRCIQSWYAKNITGNASNVVTANLSGSEAFRTIIIIEISGANATSPLDTSATAGNGTGATVTTGSFNTSAPAIILSGATEASLGNTFTEDTGYTKPTNGATSDGVSQVQYRTYSSSQTGITTSMTTSASGSDFTVTADAFKP